MEVVKKVCIVMLVFCLFLVVMVGIVDVVECCVMELLYIWFKDVENVIINVVSVDDKLV